MLRLDSHPDTLKMCSRSFAVCFMEICQKLREQLKRERICKYQALCFHSLPLPSLGSSLQKQMMEFELVGQKRPTTLLFVMKSANGKSCPWATARFSAKKYKSQRANTYREPRKEERKVNPRIYSSLVKENEWGSSLKSVTSFLNFLHTWGWNLSPN